MRIERFDAKPGPADFGVRVLVTDRDQTETAFLWFWADDGARVSIDLTMAQAKRLLALLRVAVG